MSDSLFEIALSSTHEPDVYRANVRTYTSTRGLKPQQEARIALDTAALQTLLTTAGPEEYTFRLTEYFFADSEMNSEFRFVRDMADASNGRLRFRLILPSDAPELHNLPWEMLGEWTSIDRVQPITTNGRRLFSRFLRPPARPLRESGNRLRAIVLIANPRKLKGIDLDIDEINVQEQLAAVSELMGTHTDMVILTGPKACRDGMLQELRRGADLVYVVCHGQLDGKTPRLLFETQNQEAESVTSRLLANTIAGADVLPPQLFVFGSCQSAGGINNLLEWTAGVLFSVSAQMSEAGVPAVVGMQGMVTQATSTAFYKRFFAELFESGEVERAVALGREAVAANDDWWMPLLLLTREDGQLWSNRRKRRPFNWNGVLNAMEEGSCTPIMGSEVVPPFSNRKFAQVLIDESDNEAGGATVDELAWVAQHYRVSRNLPDVTDRYNNFLRDRMRSDGITAEPGERLQERVSRWGRSETAQSHTRVIQRLAALPFEYYVTTNPDDLLEQELAKKTVNGKPCAPIKQVAPWKGDMSDLQAMDVLAGAEASESSPLVYHLFGSLMGKDQSKTTAVLTEDDFFEHLLWTAKNSNALTVKFPLTAHMLLFLGFHLRDWEFRILLQCITQLAGTAASLGITHVAVQIPETDPARQDKAEQDLRTFFRNSRVKLEVCFGTVEEFSSDILREWQRRKEVGGGDGA